MWHKFGLEIQSGEVVLSFGKEGAAWEFICDEIEMARLRWSVGRFPQLRSIKIRVVDPVSGAAETFWDVILPKKMTDLPAGAGFRDCLNWFGAFDGPSTLTWHDDDSCWIMNDRYSLDRLGGSSPEAIEGQSFVLPRGGLPAHWSPSPDKLWELKQELDFSGTARCAYWGVQSITGNLCYYDLEYRLFVDVRGGRPIRASRSHGYELVGSPEAIVRGEVSVGDDLMARARRLLAARDALLGL